MTDEIDGKEFQDFLAETRTQFSMCIEDRKRQVDQAISVISDIALAVCGENVDVFAKSTADTVEFKLCYSDGQGSLGGFDAPWKPDGDLCLPNAYVKNKIICAQMNARPILAKKLSPVEKETT